MNLQCHLIKEICPFGYFIHGIPFKLLSREFQDLKISEVLLFYYYNENYEHSTFLQRLNLSGLPTLCILYMVFLLNCFLENFKT